MKLLGALLENIGAITGIWGVFLLLLNKRARGVPWLLGIALICLLLGSSIADARSPNPPQGSETP